MRIVSEPVDMIAKFASSGSRASKAKKNRFPASFATLISQESQGRSASIRSSVPISVFPAVSELIFTAVRASLKTSKKSTN